MTNLSKMLSILNLVDRQAPYVMPEIIAVRLGVSRATGYRYVKQLCDAGILIRTKTGLYALSPRICELGSLARDRDPLIVAGGRWMRELAEKIAIPVVCSVLYDRHVINTWITETGGHMPFSYGIGHPLPLFLGAQSKLLVAFQKGQHLYSLFDSIRNDSKHPYRDTSWSEFAQEAKRIRKTGYCFTHNELNPGMAGIAAPVLMAPASHARASISVVGSKERFDLLGKELLARELLAVSQKITAAIG